MPVFAVEVAWAGAREAAETNSGEPLLLRERCYKSPNLTDDDAEP